MQVFGCPVGSAANLSRYLLRDGSRYRDGPAASDGRRNDGRCTDDHVRIDEGGEGSGIGLRMVRPGSHAVRTVRCVDPPTKRINQASSIIWQGTFRLLVASSITGECLRSRRRRPPYCSSILRRRGLGQANAASAGPAQT